MANEIPNAVNLTKDPDFRDWVRVAALYQARVSLTGDTPATPSAAQRARLSGEVLGNPFTRLEIIVKILASDPEICGVANPTVGNGITQTLLIQKMAGFWTPLAVHLFPVTP